MPSVSAMTRSLPPVPVERCFRLFHHSLPARESSLSVARFHDQVELPANELGALKGLSQRLTW
jgi:hypothetical protein